MKNTVKQKGSKVETYDFGSDFQILTSKEKRDVLKNAKNLLKLQMENNAHNSHSKIKEKE